MLKTKSLKLEFLSIIPLNTILFTNIPIMFCVSSNSLLAKGVPILISVWPVYLYSKTKNADKKTIYGETEYLDEISWTLSKYLLSIFFDIFNPLYVALWDWVKS